MLQGDQEKPHGGLEMPRSGILKMDHGGLTKWITAHNALLEMAYGALEMD